MQAAAPERVGHLAGPVAGEQEERRAPSAHGSELGDGHLPLGEDLEQERLELGVGAVDLVDQHDDGGLARRARAGSGRSTRNRRLKNAASAPAIRSAASAMDAAPAVCARHRVAQELRVEHLLGVVPLVERLGLVEPLVALQSHELPRQRLRQRAGEVRLADARRALDEERPLEGEGEPADEGELVAREVPGAGELPSEIVGRGRVHCMGAYTIARARQLAVGRGKWVS